MLWRKYLGRKKYFLANGTVSALYRDIRKRVKDGKDGCDLRFRLLWL
jgi:hypothetical protein